MCMENVFLAIDLEKYGIKFLYYFIPHLISIGTYTGINWDTAYRTFY